jgi:hypothetical protein
MLDAYDELGPKLQAWELDNGSFGLRRERGRASMGGKNGPFRRERSDSTRTVFGIPYDGRSRTAPVTPLTALILASVGVPVVMHGGDCMPTKYGVPLIEIWQGLGVDFSKLTLCPGSAITRDNRLGICLSAAALSPSAGVGSLP